MWSDFKFNDPFEGEFPEEINGVVLPDEYIEFMSLHNGGEGDTRESWLVLYRVEELQEINDDYQEDLPYGHMIIGSNGGGELFGINSSGEYFIVPDIIEEEYIDVICDSIEMLPKGINEFWSK